MEFLFGMTVGILLTVASEGALLFFALYKRKKK